MITVTSPVHLDCYSKTMRIRRGRKEEEEEEAEKEEEGNEEENNIAHQLSYIVLPPPADHGVVRILTFST